MKKYLIYITLLTSVAFMSSCASYSPGRGNKGLPPGKAKKIFGTKSAKPFAPGQRKKHGHPGKKKGKHKGKHKGHNPHRHHTTYYFPGW